MINLVAQLEKKFIAEFGIEENKDLYEMIPENLRQNILIKRQNCKPYGNKTGHIQWAAPDDKTLAYFWLGKISEKGAELYILPFPDDKSPDVEWYTEAALKEVLQNTPSVLPKIIYHRQEDGSARSLRIKDLTWDEAKSILPEIIAWTRKNQNKTRSALPQSSQTIASTVGVKEFEMVALLLRMMGGKADFQTICEKYSSTFGYPLTDTLVDGLQLAINQHTQDCDEYVGQADVFTYTLEGDKTIWALKEY